MADACTEGAYSPSMYASFALLGKTCAITGLDDACTFEGLWRATLGARTAWLVDAAIAALTFAISAVYLLCLGSLLPPVLAALRAPPALAARTPAVLLAFAAVYPLCALRSLDRLAFSSYLGVAAILYTAAFSVWRALDGSYASGGALQLANVQLEQAARDAGRAHRGAVRCSRFSPVGNCTSPLKARAGNRPSLGRAGGRCAPR